MRNKQRRNDDANPTTRDINASQRAVLALKLRAEKLTYEQIATRCGYADRQTAHKAVQREMQRVVVENVEELRKEELNTLDIMQSECMTLFLDRTNRGRLFAADRILAVMERRAKLMGLDVSKDGAIAAAQVIIREYAADVEAV